MYEMLAGLAYIHSCKILHRDMKPQNVLINSKQEVKIADFGLARTYSNELRPYSQEVVTLWYRAPELLAGPTEYTSAIDMWSVGCIFFELLTQRVLFKGTSTTSQIVCIFNLLGRPTEQELPKIKQLKMSPTEPPTMSFEAYLKEQGLDQLETDLLGQFLRFSPTKRISAKQALCHPYFDDIL